MMRAAHLLSLALLIAAIATSTAAAIGPSAPFGLSWGTTPEDVEALGVTLSGGEDGDEGTEYLATHLPQTIADVESVALYFDGDERLWKIRARSKSFADDPHGSAVRARFEQLEKLLAERYGPGEPERHQGAWRDPKRFVLTIYHGYSRYFTDYRSDAVDIRLSVEATSWHVSSYMLVFENRDLAKQFRECAEARDASAP